MTLDEALAGIKEHFIPLDPPADDFRVKLKTYIVKQDAEISRLRLRLLDERDRASRYEYPDTTGQ